MFVSLAYIINLIVTLLLVGIVWFLQIVHYPVFSSVAKEILKDFVLANRRKMMIIMFPLMSLEAFTAVVVVISLAMQLASEPVGQTAFNLAGAALIALAVIWVITFQLLAPMIKKFSFKPSDKLLAEIIKYNWIRTGLWTLRAVLLLLILF